MDDCYFTGGPWAGQHRPVESTANIVNVPELTDKGIVMHSYARADHYYPERDDQVFVYVGKKRR